MAYIVMNCILPKSGRLSHTCAVYPNYLAAILKGYIFAPE